MNDAAPAAGPSPPILHRDNGRRSLGGAARVARLARKELRETLRDRRTIGTLVLMPLILYPLLSMGFQRFLVANYGAGSGTPTYTIAVASESELLAIREALSQGNELLSRSLAREAEKDEAEARDAAAGRQRDEGGVRQFPGADGEPERRVETPQRRDNQLETPNPHDLRSPAAAVDSPEETHIDWKIHSAPESLVADMQADVAIIRMPMTRRGAAPANANGPLETESPAPDSAATEADADPNPDADADNAEPPRRFRITHRRDSLTSTEAMVFVQQRLRAWEEGQLAIWERAVGVRLPRLQFRHRILAASGKVSLGGLIPLILVLTTITGAVYPAIDLTAGERERGTLETLIAAPVPRMGLLLAKYTAVVTVALLTAGVNLIAMSVTLKAAGLGELLFGSGGLSFGALAVIFVLLILFAGFFSAVLLALTSFARSFKEAQAYLIPLMLVAIAPGLVSLMPSVELQGPLTIAPLVNIVLLSRDVLEGNAQAATATIAVASTMLYALAAIGLAARVFGTDAILYGEQQSWGELFRRPESAREESSVSSALLCLALLFPLFIIVAGLLAQWRPPSPSAGLLAKGGATLAMFAGAPLVALGVGRVRLHSGLALRAARGSALAGALLMGLTCWVIAHEAALLSQWWFGRDALTASLDQLEEVRRQLRASPVLLVVAALAIAPAVGEELFFRGFLQTALLQRWRPAVSIAATAILFGLFHVLTTPTLAVERFVTSSLMGLILGWVRHRSASVLPGIGLHAVNNGLLLMAAYYRDELERQGWSWLNQEQLPITWLAGGAAVMLAGASLVWFSGRRSAPPDKIADVTKG